MLETAGDDDRKTGDDERFPYDLMSTVFDL